MGAMVLTGEVLRTFVVGLMRLNCGNQGRQIIAHYIPNKIEVNLEVIVNQTISHSGNLAPGQNWKFVSRLIGNLSGGFPNNNDH